MVILVIFFSMLFRYSVCVGARLICSCWQEFKVKVNFTAGPEWSVAFEAQEEDVVRVSLAKAGLEAGGL